MPPKARPAARGKAKAKAKARGVAKARARVRLRPAANVGRAAEKDQQWLEGLMVRYF